MPNHYLNSNLTRHCVFSLRNVIIFYSSVF
uniref:Uncharacterized protein n=1 Tax=Anguilla anguilla TaxID=7936 RepID=A0A0E9VRS2_ANGAN